MNTNAHIPSAGGPRRSGRILCAALGSLTLLLAGCAPRDGGSGSKGHAHVAPHGGTLVELGNHQFNIEFVFDAERRTLRAYFLDGHAEAFVRVGVPEFVVTANAAGKRHLLMFKPVANAVTGETAGNASLYEAEAEWLAAAKAFDGTLQAVNVRNTVFTNVAFKFSLEQTPDDPWAKKKN